ncbi:MAG: M24 family metallopeptidase [Kiritimatiellales bacterium]
MNRQESMQIARPPELTADELRLKLNHLAGILSGEGFGAIALCSEGAMRWLTGLKHQLGDIAPPAPAPVNALVDFSAAGKIKITIISKPFEMPRLKDEIPAVFEPVPEIEFSFAETYPAPPVSTLTPEHEKYAVVIDAAIRPLLGGFDGNPFKKIDWISRTAMQALGDAARRLDEGMNGLVVRGIILEELYRRGIDANLVLVALAEQESHLHPVASVKYTLEKDRWMKLVIGARYAEHIVSQSLMVKLGGAVSAEETAVYRALQTAAVEYADLYRAGAIERDIYTGLLERFRQVEEETGLTGFAKSATLHHCGGGTSPLGNRDRMLNPDGKLVCDAWTQFAINPVDVLCGFKVELQGLILPGGVSPLMLDMHSAAAGIPFHVITAQSGMQAMLPDLMVV